MGRLQEVSHVVESHLNVLKVPNVLVRSPFHGRNVSHFWRAFSDSFPLRICQVSPFQDETCDKYPPRN